MASSATSWRRAMVCMASLQEVRVKGKQPALHEQRGLVDGEAERGDQRQHREHQRGVHGSLRGDDQRAQALAGADEFAHDRADQRQHDGHAEAGQDGGQPEGSFSRSVWVRVAPSMRNSSSRSGGTCCRAVSVFSISGKKQISAVMTTVEVMPKPNHSMNSGASASLGITWLATT